MRRCSACGWYEPRRKRSVWRSHELGPDSAEPFQVVLPDPGPQVEGDRRGGHGAGGEAGLGHRPNCSSESERPGSTGAISTPHGTPASFSRLTASIRLSGGGVPGSVSFHTSRSSVPMETSSRTRVRAAASTSRPRSRRTSVDFVRMLKGLAASLSTRTIPCVRWYLPSAFWYGSVFVPIAMCSPAHLGERSSARSRSTALTLTTILRSKSSPIPRPRYSCVGRAKQYVQA